MTTDKSYRKVINQRYEIILLNIVIIFLTLLSIYISETVSYLYNDNKSTDGVVNQRNNVLQISNQNATSALNERFALVYDDFIDATNDEKNWKILRTGTNISIETYDGGKNIWPLYIRTTTMIDKPSSNVSSLFEWNLFDKTQRKVDPFYESSSSLYFNDADRNNVRVIQKMTKRPLIFPKREFLLGLLHRTSKSDVVVRKARAKSVSILYDEVDQKFNNDVKAAIKENYFIIQKGTKMCALLNVDISPSINKNPFNGEHTKAYQDFIAWYTDADKGGKTLLTIVMRVDLGSDIPRWAFLTTVAATGIRSMKSLNSI